MWYFEIALGLLALGCALGLVAQVWQMLVPALVAAALLGVAEADLGGGVLMIGLRVVEALVLIQVGYFVGALLAKARQMVRSRPPEMAAVSGEFGVVTPFRRR